MLRRLPLLAAMILAAAPATGQDLEQKQAWRAVSYLEDANLEGRGIFFIDFEADGTAWIAASDGLYRYDGFRWDRYTSADGLPSDYVRSVRVTRDGTLWVGTDRGAGVFDGETFDSRQTQAHLAGPSVRRIVEDPDGTLWFCCDQWPPSDVGAGLTRYRDGEWKSWTAEDGLPSDYVSDVYLDTHGRHFVLTRRGLARLDGERLSRPIEEAGLPECRDYIWSVVESADDELIATTDEWICLERNGRWSRVPNGPPRIALGQLTATRDGTVLACTSEPAARFVEWKNGRLIPVWTSQLDSRSTVQHIGEAPDGSIWIAGTNLLARWERLGGEWRTFDDLPSPRLRDVEDAIWFADDQRVLRLRDDEWTQFPDASGPLIGDSAGGVWMHSAGGLARWSRDGVRRFTQDAIGLSNPRSASVDGAGDLWVIGIGPDGRERFASFDGKDWTSRPMAGIEPDERIVFGTPDPRRGMWYILRNVEADGYRLVRVDRTSIADVPLPVAARRYWMPRVHADRAGRLWLFGLLGLYRQDLTADSPAWRQVTELPGTEVMNVVERENEIWFSYLGSTGGSGGISRLRDDAWRHFSSAGRQLTSQDGNGSLFFTHPRGVAFVAPGSTEPPRLLALPETVDVDSLVSGPRGELWIGSAERVFRYRPDGIPPDTVILHGDKDVFHGEPLVLHVRGVERFKPLARSGDFNVALQVDDQPWGAFEPLTERRISVGGLTAGDHVVRVRVRDQGLDVDDTPAVWHFRRHTVPLQDRRWFRTAVAGIALIVLLLAGVSVAARRRETAQRRRQQELEHEILGVSEREQRRIGHDLHDGLGQQLTSISFQCERLRRMLDENEPSSSQYAEEIGAAVRGAISETRLLAYSLYPPEIDRGDLHVALDNLVTSVDRGFDGTCTYRHRWSPPDLSREDALHVYRLVQEALNNATRHAGAKTLTIESRLDDGNWTTEVHDDGRGFDTKHPTGTGLGLQIMRYRADQIGARLIVNSRPGHGTTVRCVLSRRRSS